MSLAPLRLALTTVPATLPSRRTVMRSVTDRASSRSCDTNETLFAVSDAPADDIEGQVPVGARRDRRLVEDQESAARIILLRVLGQVLERADGQQSALHRQVGDSRARVELQPESGEGLLGALSLLAPADQPLGLRGDRPGADVFHYRQRRQQAEVLVSSFSPRSEADPVAPAASPGRPSTSSSPPGSGWW